MGSNALTIVLTIAGILAIIALLIFIIPRLPLSDERMSALNQDRF